MTNKSKVLPPLVAVVVVAIGWAVVWLASAGSLPGTRGSYHVKAVVPSAEFLGAGANVTIAGIKVGHVDSITRKPGSAELTLSINADEAPLPSDSRFDVRLRSVVGENYLEITPGTARTVIPNGGALPMSGARRYVNVDEILNTLKGPTRDRARETLQGLDAALADRGRKANATLGGAAATVYASSPVVRVLAGEDDKIARLTDDLGALSRTIGTRGEQLREAAQLGTVTAKAISSRDAAVRTILDRLPATLTQIRTTTAVLGKVSDHATPTLLNVGRLLSDVRPAAARLKPAATAGSALVSELGRSALPLAGVVGRLQATAPTLTAALPTLRKTMCQLNPIATYLKPYAQDIGSVIPNMGYAANAYDATGHEARLHLAIGENELKILSPETSKAVQGLLDLGVIGLSHNQGYDPYPAPGQAAEVAKSGDPTGFTEVTKKYPHVEAEC